MESLVTIPIGCPRDKIGDSTHDHKEEVHGKAQPNEQSGATIPPHLADNLQALADSAGLDGYLFYAQTNMKKPCKPHSTPISDRTVKGNVRRACERLREENPDFPIITPYDLRHSFETNVQNSEGQRLAEQYVLNAYMGHADATMGDYYARVRNGDFERLAEAVSRATFPQTLGDNVTSIDKLLRA